MCVCQHAPGQGVCVSQHAPGQGVWVSQHTPGQGVWVSQHTPGQRVYPSMHLVRGVDRGIWKGGMWTRGVDRDVDEGVRPPSQTATDAVGKHSTGMHSCLIGLS